MDFWIKTICILFFTSCSITNTELLQKKDSINITSEIKNSPYAMQFIEVGNEIEDIFLLSDVRNETQYWFMEKDFFIFSKHGKIIKSVGLNNDFEILSYSGFKSFEKSQSLIRFNNPESGFMDIFFSYKLLKDGTMKKIINNEDFNYRLVEESFEVPLIKWKGRNYYWIDSEDDIWMSKQTIDPFGKKARITVLKKYSD